MLVAKKATENDQISLQQKHLQSAAMEKSRIWRANSKVTPLDSVVSAHPQNISLSLPKELKKCEALARFISPLLIALNPKSKVWYKKQKRVTPILDVDGRT